MRLLLKTLSYGATHVTVATAVAYMLTGDLLVALSLGLIEPLIQTGVFALHEQLWEGSRPVAGPTPTDHGPLQVA